MAKILRPGKLTETDREKLAVFQQAHTLKADGDPGHQTANYMMDLIRELARDVESLDRKLRECMNMTLPAQEPRAWPMLTFIGGVAVGAMIGLLVGSGLV